MSGNENDVNIIHDRNTLIIVSIIIFGVTLIDGIDTHMISIALPVIGEQLGLSISDCSWVTNAYVIGIAAFLLLFVKLADIGYCRKLFVIGIIIFAISSLLCALSTNSLMMIVFRFIQGLGGSMMGAVAPIVVVRCFPKNMIGHGMAILALATGSSIVIGPALGGFLTSIDWRIIFLINIPICLVLILAGIWKLPVVKNFMSKGLPDKLSVIYVAIFLIALLIFLQHLIDYIEGDNIPIWILVASAIVTAASLILLIKRVNSDVPNSVINKRLFKNWEFLAVSLSFFLTTMMSSGLNFLLPFTLKIEWMMNSVESGLMMTISSISMIIVSLFVGKWCDAKGCKTPTVVAIIFRIAFSLLFLVMTPAWGVGSMVVGLIIAGTSFGLSGTSQPTRMNHHTEPELRGEASAIMLAINYVGSMAGVASYVLMVNIGSAVQSPLSFFQFPMFLGIVLGFAALVCTLIVRNIVPEKTKE